MAEEAGRPIIVKRVVKRGGDGHHGGAWKVAYADFVTAMMAFFLLMWLLNATTEKQRKGIADYFNPSIPLARISGGGEGMLGGESVLVERWRAGGEAPEDPVAAPDPRGEEDGAAGRSAASGGQGPGAFDAAYRDEQARLEAVARELESAVSNAAAGLARHFVVHMEPEGLVIELVETGERPLFESGSAEPSPRLRELLAILVPLIGLTTNPVAIVGHTDARPFGSGLYGNWELSSDRANAARRAMSALGLPGERIARVSGRAATVPLTDDPGDPENRRIAITLLRETAR
jgi:chemotaxis protein MotB